MQVILGSGGAIGRPLAHALANYTPAVRCCSRTPHALPDVFGTTYEHRVTDLLDRDAVRRAVAGAEIVYLTAGLPYRTATWRRDWPVLIDNVIAACTEAGARLAFFDNVYALDPADYGRMTEDVALSPTSNKGRIRKQVLDKLWAAHRSGRLPVTVARAADFYGPSVTSSLFNAMVLDKVAADSAGMWTGDPTLPHSLTYTPDAGRFFALLANDERAWGETWHLPTDARQLSVNDLAGMVSPSAKVRQLVAPLFWLLGRFNADLRELWDVRAQFNQPYFFDSSRFTTTFGVTATPYEEGLRQSVQQGAAAGAK